MKALLRNMWNDEAGQDMIEYALIAGLISVIAFAAIQAAGLSVSGIWNTISADLNQAN